MQEIGICIAIIIGKILDVGIFTVRTTLSTRDEKMWVTILGAINNLIGISLLATVISGINESFYRALSFALGEALGTYFGMVVDQKMAIGSNIVTIIVNKSISKKIENRLVKEGFKCTIINGKGLKEERSVIKVHVERKKDTRLREILSEENAHAVVFESKLLNIKKSNYLKEELSAYDNN